MDFGKLKAELDLPLYSGMTDKAAATELNDPNKTVRLLTMSGDDLFKNTDATEFISLTDAKKAQWLALCALRSVDPSGVVEQVVTDIWGAGTTLNNLGNFRDPSISRASELGLGSVVSENVRYARTL